MINLGEVPRAIPTEQLASDRHVRVVDGIVRRGSLPESKLSSLVKPDTIPPVEDEARPFLCLQSPLSGVPLHLIFWNHFRKPFSAVYSWN